MRVLLIDDSPPIRARLRALLGEVGGVDQVDEAADGDLGIALARATAPDVVVLDLQLAGRGGLDVLARLKEGASPPVVIVLTNHASDAYRRECFARAADYFFDKSVDFARAALVLRELDAGGARKHPRA